MKPSPKAVVVLLLFPAFLFLATVCGGVPSAAAQTIEVTSATPSSAAQGTINLNVSVKGKGFKKGAQAKWFVTGSANPGGVTVNSTAFVNPGEVTANITVADTADIANFDIVVQNSDGRSGKGTELFAVTAKPNSCTSDVQLKAIFAPGNGGSLRLVYGDSDSGTTARTYSNPSDPEFDGGSVYTDGADGIFVQFQVCNGSNDLIINLGNSSRFLNFKFSQQLTSPDPRAVDVAGGTYKANFLNGSAMFTTPLGGTLTTCLGGQLQGIAQVAQYKFQNPATYQVNGGLCLGGGAAQTANIGGDTSLIQVEHPDVCTWIIRPVADGSGFYRGGVAETIRNKLFSGGQYNLPFAIKLVNKGCQ